MKPAIELTSRCNQNCQMCPFRVGGDFRDLGDMEWDTFTKLVDELAPQSEAIMLFNRGEPFVYPKIYEALEYVSKRCNWIVSTNGALIIPDKFYKSVGDRPGTLVISLPAGEARVHREITGSRSFASIKAKILSLQRQKPPNVEMYIKMVRQPNNVGQDEKIRKQFGHVVVVEDSNRPNPEGYTQCTQPNITPVWDYRGMKKVCCRDEKCEYPWAENYQRAINRELPICKRCAIA